MLKSKCVWNVLLGGILVEIFICGIFQIADYMFSVTTVYTIYYHTCVNFIAGRVRM